MYYEPGILQTFHLQPEEADTPAPFTCQRRHWQTDKYAMRAIAINQTIMQRRKIMRLHDFFTTNLRSFLQTETAIIAQFAGHLGQLFFLVGYYNPNLRGKV
jgi:hypothetical protein